MATIERLWPLEIVFTEDDRVTRADAMLDVGGRHFHGWGRSRRNPADPEVRRVGEEVAAARALNDLADQLASAASLDIEGWEHRPVHVRA